MVGDGVMPNSWKEVLDAFLYPVNLRDYERGREFPGFFNMKISGNRDSTIAFENHYQEAASANIAAFFEVVFWKLYSQKSRCQKGTTRIISFVQENGITSKQLWDSVQQFVKLQTMENLEGIRKLLGIVTDVLAIPLTLPALASPKTIPMIDIQVARWVNHNAYTHSINRINRLTPFKMNYTSLRDNDFLAYLNWVAWCREVAQVLTNIRKEEWRARDVEMAVFTAQRNRMVLNTLP